MSTRQLIKDNSKEILKLLLKRLECNFNIDIVAEMEEHPDFPSFLAFQHILKKIGIDSIALSTNETDLRFNLPKPALVHISSNDGMFLLIEKIDEQFAYIINEKSELEKQPINDFLKIWDGYAMIFDIENIKRTKLKFIDKIKLFLKRICKPFAIFSFVTILITSFIFHKHRNVFNILYILEFSSGIFFSVLLLIEYFDKQNLFIKNICLSKNNKKINCSSILNSKDAYFLGLVSWSDVGFIYFAILFTLCLFFPVDLSLTFSVFTSVFIFPYVFYSLYYQKFIAKSWCVLCLCVQGVIISVTATSIFAYKQAKFSNLILPENLILILLLSLAIIGAYIVIKPLIYSHVNIADVVRNLKTLKHNSDIIAILFNDQKFYDLDSINKINVGNPEGDNCITVIFSPICEPCIAELSKLLPLLKFKESTRIEFLFLVDKKESIMAFNIAKHMLIKYNQDKDNFISILENYVNEYPVSKLKYEKLSFTENENSSIDQLIFDQEQWCIKNKIFSTPQIFLNSKVLPAMYTVNDLDYIVS